MEFLEDRTLPTGGLPYLTPSTISQLTADIVYANSNTGSYTITLASGTNFVFTSWDNYTNGPTALPVLTGNITIVGNGDTLERSSSAVGGYFRLFDVASGGSLSLENATLTHGFAAVGGAIYSSGTLTLTGVTLKSNTAQGSPGGEAVTGANGGTGYDAAGGGLYVAGGTVTLSNDTFSGNLAQGGQGGGGGQGSPGSPGSFGYYTTNYYYTRSGAAYTTQYWNPASPGGRGGTGGAGGNGGAGFGGGLYVAGGAVTLNNDTLSSNLANPGSGGNGGLGGLGGAGSPNGPSGPGGIPGNSGAGIGGGIYVGSGSVTLHNTLISGNAGGDVSGTLDSASDYSLIGDGSGGLSTANHNLLGSSASPLDPLLAPLGNNGGPTQTMALLPRSPAIDAGSNAYVTPGETDQRGDPRISGPSVDIGAYEFQQQSPQTITFNPLPNPTYGDPDFALTATASSGLPVSYSATGNATVYQDTSGNWFAHITGAGMATITASQAGNNAYFAAPDVSQTFTISPAKIGYTIGNDTQAYGYPANLAADLPASFSTGINGETLDITYSSTGDTSTAKPGTYANTGVVSNGTGLASNYIVTLTNGTLTVLGSGVTVVGNQLWIVGGTNTNDHVDVDPAGRSKTGSTGLRVETTLNHVHSATTYHQDFTDLYIFLYGGNDKIDVAKTLTINTTINGGNGNDRVRLGEGNNTVTLGNGNDRVAAGDGNNVVTLGNGNDHIRVGNGNNVIVEGNGNDDIDAGNGDNLIVAGLGRHEVDVGKGSNILIDGSVQLTQSGDSLRQVLDDWIKYGAQAANVASIRSRLSVTYNSHHANELHAGSGLDWFWATDSHDCLNAKPTDLRN